MRRHLALAFALIVAAFALPPRASSAQVFPLPYGTQVCDTNQEQQVALTISTTTLVQAIAPVANQAIYVCGIYTSTAPTLTNVNVEYGNANCATVNGYLLNSWRLGTAASIFYAGQQVVPVGNALCVVSSVASAFSITIVYVQMGVVLP